VNINKPVIDYRKLTKSIESLAWEGEFVKPKEATKCGESLFGISGKASRVGKCRLGQGAEDCGANGRRSTEEPAVFRRSRAENRPSDIGGGVVPNHAARRPCMAKGVRA
jgi:hypothetical protein